MALKSSVDSQFTAQVNSLVNVIYGRKNSTDPSVVSQAVAYFASVEKAQKNIDAHQAQINELQQKVNVADDAKQKKKYQQQLSFEQQSLEKLQLEVMSDSLSRNRFLVMIAEEVLSLSEGESFAESNRKSAKLLGTIQLQVNTESSNVAEEHDRYKSLYKAVLCLRLLDRLFLDNKVNSDYINQFVTDLTPEEYEDLYELYPEQHHEFMDQVRVPIVMAALLQDIGNYHPDAQRILNGDDGKADPFRTFEEDERKQLLQINYRETINYLMQGIGLGKYVGDLKEERIKFEQQEKQKLAFMRHLLKSWVNPQNGIGNLLKVPQIYTSIILSTKPNYHFKLIPNVYQVLETSAERGNCSDEVVQALKQITGMFPQGFGVTFIPKDSDGNSYDRFEYAIVNQLYPPDFESAYCRTTTRNLTFISRGFDILVKRDQNLYFKETAKTLAKISKKRLHEILEKLASNFQERQKADVLPRCWHARDYFSVPNHQNLWNKVGSD